MGQKEWSPYGKRQGYEAYDYEKYRDQAGRRAFVEGRSMGTLKGADEVSAMEFIPDLPLAMDMLQPRPNGAKVVSSDSAGGEPAAKDCAPENIQAAEEKDLDVQDDKFTSKDTLTNTFFATRGELTQTVTTASAPTHVLTTPQIRRIGPRYKQHCCIPPREPRLHSHSYSSSSSQQLQDGWQR